MRKLSAFVLFVLGHIRHWFGLCPNCSFYELDCMLCGGNGNNDEFTRAQRYQDFMRLIRTLHNE